MIKGNTTQLATLKSWLSSYNKSSPKYYILTSDYNGNGITTITKYLANLFNFKYTEITMLDIASRDDLPKIQNLLFSYDFSQRKRLIIFDEITEIPYKSQIFKMISYAKNPIILTTTKLYALPKQYRKNVIRIYKPSINDMVDILTKKMKEYDINLPNSKLIEIINSSQSVATAINSLLSQFSSNMDGSTSYYSMYYNFQKQHVIKADSIFLYWLIDNINDVENFDYMRFLIALHLFLLNNHAIDITIPKNAKFNQQPTYPLYFQYKASSLKKRKKLMVFLSKIASILHTSTKDIINSYLQILKNIDNKWMQSEANNLELDEEELDMLGLKCERKKDKIKSQIRLDGYW